MKIFYLPIILITFPFLADAQVSSRQYEVENGLRHSSEIRRGVTYIESMKILRPKPNTSAGSLAKINPSLPVLLKDYTKLIESAQVSSRFNEIS